MANTPNSNTVYWVETNQQFHAALKDRKDSDLILVLSEKVTLSELEAPGCYYYDDLAELPELEAGIRQTEHFLETWFLDEAGKDYSQLDGPSFGLLFLPSLHYLYLTYLRYYLALIRFLKKQQFQIKTYSNIHPCALRAAEAYAQQFDCELNIAEVGPFQVDKDSQYQIELDYQGRQRDLSNVFRPLTRALRILSRIQSHFLKKKSFETLLTQGNKVQSLLMHGHSNQQNNEFLFPIPKRELLSGKVSFSHGYLELNAIAATPRVSTEKLETKIEEQYHAKFEGDIFHDYFFKILKEKTFHYFTPAQQKYAQYLSFFKKVRVKKALFTADSHENNLLLAMATKACGIRNILTPHGLYGYGYPLYKNGKFQLFDEFIAFGNKDREDYLRDGIPSSNIYTAPIPHFANYKPIANKSERPKAILLPLEYSNIALGSSLRDQKQFLIDAIDVLQELDIEILGIKFRGHHALRPMQQELKRFKDLKILDPNRPLGHYFEQANMIIGTSGSAMIEATLCGLKYYCCHSKHETIANKYAYLKILDFYHSAQSKDELKQNIQNDRRFKTNRNIQDLLELGEDYSFAESAAQYLKTIQSI